MSTEIQAKLKGREDLPFERHIYLSEPHIYFAGQGVLCPLMNTKVITGFSSALVPVLGQTNLVHVVTT
jgi:hypothetical protein